MKFCDEEDIEIGSEEENVNNNSNQKFKKEETHQNNKNVNKSYDRIIKKEIKVEKERDKEITKKVSPSPRYGYEQNKDESLNKSTEKSVKETKKPLNNYNKNKNRNNNEKTQVKNSKNPSGINNLSNCEINFDEEMILSSISSNKNRPLKVSTSQNLRNKTPNNHKENRLNTSGLNISGGFNEGAYKSSTKNKNKRTISNFKDLNKSRDKSFNMDNEEEKIEKNKIIRKKRYTRNHRIIESMNKSEEKRIPKRKADYSIFKTEMNQNFIKNAPKKEGKNLKNYLINS